MTGIEGDLFIALALAFGVGVSIDCAAEASELLDAEGWMLSLDELGVLRGDLTVTCLPAVCEPVGVVGIAVADATGTGAAAGRVVVVAAVGVVGAVTAAGAAEVLMEISTLRLGDLPTWDWEESAEGGDGGEVDSIPSSSGRRNGGILYATYQH